MEYILNGYLWRIHFINSNSDLLRRSDGTLTVGMCDGNTCDIYLSDKLRGGFLRKVLLHEVCHSAVFSFGIELSIDEEERLCDFVATYCDDIVGTVDNMISVIRLIA